MLKIIVYITAALLSVFFISCRNNNSLTSSTTGWRYDFTNENAFRRSLLPTSNGLPPGMVAIEGGSFSIDDIQDYVTASRRERQNDPSVRKVLNVNSFYMDIREVRNIDWREYLVWLNTVYGNVAPEILEQARPNMNEWMQGISDNDPFLKNYFSHPSFNEYPVVCVSWEQAQAYCIWRTDRVNELILIQRGLIEAPDFNRIRNLATLEEVQAAVFSSARFFGSIEDNLGTTAVGMFPNFRLPTEDEWEYAAYGRRPSDPEDKIRIYPWSEIIHPRLTPRQRSQQRAHFNTSNTFGRSTDVFSRTVPAGHFAPNDFGLYNMAGNVNEWVFDQYPNRAHRNRIDSVEVLDAFLPEFHRSTDNRIYKGGSWKDPIYWLHPATSRYLDRRASANHIGFRCAMNMVSVSRNP